MMNDLYLKEKFPNTIINVNGELKKPEEAVISIFDRSFLYGDSVYEVTRSYEGKIFALEEHIERLWQSMDFLSFEDRPHKEELKNQIQSTFKALNKSNCYIRIIVSRGVGEIGLDIKKVNRPNVVIIIREMAPNPSEWYEKGVDYIIASTKRMPKDSLNPMAKTGNYLNSILGLIEAKKLKAFDAILLDHEGYVCEGTTNNLWIVKNKNVFTPSLSRSILNGITRQFIMTFQSQNFKIGEKDFFIDELLSADEVFLTSSLKEVVPITKINNQPIHDGLPGKISKEIHSIYKDNIQHFINKGIV
jgi:branched-chain amino acid aminotransferase